MKLHGMTRWESIRKLKQAGAGCRPVRPTATRKENGELTQGPSEVLQRWHQHFSKLLNQQTEFSCDMIEQMPVLPPWLDLDGPPTKEELEQALSKIKRGKAKGKQASCLNWCCLVVHPSETGCWS